jgi:hypothetical protein
MPTLLVTRVSYQAFLLTNIFTLMILILRKDAKRLEGPAKEVTRSSASEARRVQCTLSAPVYLLIYMHYHHMCRVRRAARPVLAVLWQQLRFSPETRPSAHFDGKSNMNIALPVQQLLRSPTCTCRLLVPQLLRRAAYVK